MRILDILFTTALAVAFIFVSVKSHNQVEEIFQLKQKIIALESDTSFTNSIMQKSMEYGYFEGQRALLDGKLRIAKDKNGFWYWTESPNKDGKDPVFYPMILGKDY